jgi:rhodanese-related sulfurtransferase
MPTPPAAITPAELSQLIASGASLRLLDVREPAEFTSPLGHVEGAELVPLGTLAAAITKFRGEAREVIVICKSGARASRAADFLSREGLKTKVLVGGMMAWNDAKLPISR